MVYPLVDHVFNPTTLLKLERVSALHLPACIAGNYIPASDQQIISTSQPTAGTLFGHLSVNYWHTFWPSVSQLLVHFLAICQSTAGTLFGHLSANCWHTFWSSVSQLLAHCQLPFSWPKVYSQPIGFVFTLGYPIDGNRWSEIQSNNQSIWIVTIS